MGFFVVPVVGAIIGFVLGIFVVELGRSRDRSQAWTRTKHALVAVLHSMGIELAAALAITALYVAGVVAELTPRAARPEPGLTSCSWRRSQRSSSRSMNDRWPLLGLAALGPVRLGGAVAADDPEAGLPGRGEGEDRRGDHQGEAQCADPHGGADADEHQSEPGDDADDTDQPSPSLQPGQRPALHLRGELGVLGSKSLLHLLEHLLLVL